MTDSLARPVPESFREQANVDPATYDQLYRQSLDDSDRGSR